jgi:site-specific DNA-methyltransferase (adenine-specific)
VSEPRKEVIGDAELWLGSAIDVLPTLGRVDVVVTDPPYGIGFEYQGYEDSVENLRALITGVIEPCRGISSRVLSFCSHSMISEFPSPDWVFCISWNTTGSYSKLGVCQWTPVLFWGSDIAGFGSVNGVLKSDVITISGGAGVGFARREEIDHPCPKPVNLMQRLLARFSCPDETVLDPFLGSGTTGVACAKLGRRFIGIEIEPTYFDIACRRIEAAYSQADLFIEPPSRPVQTDLLAEALP